MNDKFKETINITLDKLNKEIEKDDILNASNNKISTLSECLLKLTDCYVKTHNIL